MAYPCQLNVFLRVAEPSPNVMLVAVGRWKDIHGQPRQSFGTCVRP